MTAKAYEATFADLWWTGEEEKGYGIRDTGYKCASGAQTGMSVSHLNFGGNRHGE